MSADLSLPLEEYYKVPNEMKNRNFPVHLLEKMRDYLVKQYEENLFEIYEGMLMLILNPEDKDKLKILSKEVEKIKEDFELYNSILENNTTIGEYVNMVMNELQKLIDGLKKNEEEFYKEVLNSDNPNFLITTYYSLYLRFVTTVYLKLHKTNITNPNIKTKDSRIKDIFNIANFLVGFFGIPILIYIKKKEVFPYISELSGALLHALVADRTPMPSKDSLGYYLFSKIHVVKNESK
ncbi:conserved hypothetical protein [Sulfolobus islandicus Y.G.57.14]|uniref:Uncharacterized protein n=1 Tax=Saccharolobus islandicus (strain Y.G.57.14 / Yellowstone \|nr:hypothetical protein [Sulfolobus islandicus]ACP45896.1 conserved hypothetical protein [Sulfolobus islandicus Y.G.57.14]